MAQNDQQLPLFSDLLDTAELVLDSSTIILCDGAGFLATAATSLKLHAPRAVIDEVRRGSPVPDLSSIASHTPPLVSDEGSVAEPSADRQVIDLGAHLRIPVTTDDMEVFARVIAQGRVAFVSLTLLELLLLRGQVNDDKYLQCRRSLRDLIEYPDPVYRWCVGLHQEVQKQGTIGTL